MSKTLLIIQSYGGAREQVFWSWPFYKTPGWTILGVTRSDSTHDWPEPIDSVPIGLSGYTATMNPVRNLVATFDYVLSEPRFDSFSDFCMIEYDGVIIRKPPAHSGGLCTKLAGGPIAGYKATKFFHTPWWPDRDTAKRIVSEGKAMIAEGELEHGSPDLFLGLLTDRLKMQWTNTHTFSVNGGNFSDRKHEAVKPIRDGVWYVHGLRTKAELDWIARQMKT